MYCLSPKNPGPLRKLVYCFLLQLLLARLICDTSILCIVSSRSSPFFCDVQINKIQFKFDSMHAVILSKEKHQVRHFFKINFVCKSVRKAFQWDFKNGWVI